jgi:hypothetical protein
MPEHPGPSNSVRKSASGGLGLVALDRAAILALSGDVAADPLKRHHRATAAMAEAA